jgi:hypothetical protein
MNADKKHLKNKMDGIDRLHGIQTGASYQFHENPVACLSSCFHRRSSAFIGV